jgi:hypothetical protein
MMMMMMMMMYLDKYRRVEDNRGNVKSAIRRDRVIHA